MYSVAVIGDSPVAHIAALACKAAGFSNTKQFASVNTHSVDENTVQCIPASASRIINALSPKSIESIGLRPDREQVRLGRSAYLLSELPLGNFYFDRYGAPLVNCTRKELIELLAQHDALDPIHEINSSEPIKEIEEDYELAIFCDGMGTEENKPNSPIGGFDIYTANVEKITYYAMPMLLGWARDKSSYKGLANPIPTTLLSPMANCHLKNNNGTQVWRRLLQTKALHKHSALSTTPLQSTSKMAGAPILAMPVTLSTRLFWNRITVV